MNSPIRGRQQIVLAGVNPRLEVLPPPLRVNMRSPSNGEGVHSILVFQDMGGVKTVFAARAWNNTVIRTVITPVFVAQRPQLLLPSLPVDFCALFLCKSTRVTHTLLIKINSLFLGIRLIQKLDR